jgi:hypothetical protein
MTTKNKRPIDQAIDLPYFGRKFPFIPRKLGSRLRISLVFSANHFREIGAIQFLAFFLRLPSRLAPTHKDFQKGFELIRGRFGLVAEIEWLLLVILYKDLEKTRGKKKAYKFAQKSIQQSSYFMMKDFYQADRLADFEDLFEAFWSYFKAMFQNDPDFENEFVDEGHLKTMIFYKCLNC